MIPLRQDLQLIEQQVDEHGAPLWKIYDKVRHRYFQIGWLEFEILSRWYMADKQAIIKAINAETTLKISLSHVESIELFLIQNQLAVTDNVLALQQQQQEVKKVSFKKLSTGYLFFYLPLFSPDKFLDKTLPYLKKLFNRLTITLFVMMGVIGLYLISRQWQQFIAPFNQFTNFSSIVIFVFAMLFVKVIHEFAHAYVAKYYGCHVSTIGVALLVFFPVLYTDTTDSWKLDNDKQRLWINAAGILAELSIAVIATFVWSFMPYGTWQTVVTYIAVISWALSLLVNLNPLLRFDGYYLLADYLGIANLQSQGFELARWHLRKRVFSIDEPPPKLYSEKRQRILLSYAYCTWIYRFFLMVSIAYFIYTFFFKALGIILMNIAVFYFLLIPIVSEIKVMWKKRAHISMNISSKLSMGLIAGFLLLLFIPWHNRISIPAVIEYTKQTKLYTQHAGVVDIYLLRNNEEVVNDQTVLVLANPTLSHEIKQVKTEIASVKLHLHQRLAARKKQRHLQATEFDLANLHKRLNGLLLEQEQLKVKAPFTGNITALEQGIQPGVWLGKDRLIAQLVDRSQPNIIAYLPEAKLSQVKVGDSAIFYPTARDGEKLHLIIKRIDLNTTQKLNKPYQASLYGGDITVVDSNLVVDSAIYRVHFKLVAPPKKQLAFTGSARVTITGESQSFISRMYRSISAVLIRELGM